MSQQRIFQIVAVILFLIIRFIIKASKNKTGTTSNNAPPQQNNPFQQQNNPFQQQNYQQPSQKTQQQNSANQKPNYQNTFTSAEDFNPMGNNPQPVSTSVYCLYCGKKFSNTKLLMMDTCFKHPKSDIGLQKHELYRGMGKPNVGM